MRRLEVLLSAVGRESKFALLAADGSWIVSYAGNDSTGAIRMHACTGSNAPRAIPCC
jgi:hypothetical protein